MPFVYRRPWNYAVHRYAYLKNHPSYTDADTTAPTYSVQPSVTKNADGTISVSSTASDNKSPYYDKAYVVFASGSEGTPSGSDIFNQTNDASGALFAGTRLAVTSGQSHTFVDIGSFSSGTYVYQEAIRDDAGNYQTATDQTFTITVSLYVDILPMRIVRHSGRYH